MPAGGLSSPSAGRIYEVTQDAVSPGAASPSLHLLDLPTELLIEVLRDAPRAVRTTCRVFRSLLDAGQTALRLGPAPHRGARQLTHLTALLHRLPSLASLNVGCFEFTSLGFLTACPTLNSLTLAAAPRLPHAALASLTACQRLRSLDLSGCKKFFSIRALPALTALQSLVLGNCDAGVGHLTRCPHVTSLTLGKTVTSLRPLTALMALASLVCKGGDYEDLVGLESCAASLTLLHLADTSVTDLTPLSGHSRLTSLVLETADEITTLAPLALSGGSLTHLRLDYCEVSDLRPLSYCTALTSLQLQGILALTDIRPLASCTALATLCLRSCMDLASLAPLSSLGCSLTHLDVASCDVEDISALAPCTALRHLVLSGTKVTSLLPLATCTQLRTLCLTHCAILLAQMEGLQLQIPHLRVEFERPSSP